VKGITLYQPYATAIPIGWKTNETRGWSTTWRGLIAIHAARERSRSVMDVDEKARELLAQAAFSINLLPAFPRGAIVAVARLVNVVHVEHVGPISDLERAFGDYGPGRFAWRLEDIKALEPIACKGQQGIWDVPQDIKAEIERRIAA
jgi:activating signal cointegrator 1